MPAAGNLNETRSLERTPVDLFEYQSTSQGSWVMLDMAISAV
jgi:hypothetical protein